MKRVLWTLPDVAGTTSNNGSRTIFFPSRVLRDKPHAEEHHAERTPVARRGEGPVHADFDSGALERLGGSQLVSARPRVRVGRDFAAVKQKHDLAGRSVRRNVELGADLLGGCGTLQDDDTGLRHPAIIGEDAADNLVGGPGRIGGHVLQRGMPLHHHAGGDAVDGAGGNAEGEVAFLHGGVSRVGVQADEAQRNRGLNFGIGEARERGGEFDAMAEFAAHDDVAGTNVLALVRGHAVVALQVIAEAPIVVHPHAVAFGGGVERGGEGAVAVPVLVVDGGEKERDGELRGECGRQPFDGQARGEDGDGGGHGQQVAGGSGEEDDQGAGKEDADPGEQETGVGLAAPAPREDRGGRHEGGEDDPPGVDEEHQRVLQFVLDGLEGVGGEVLGELACGHGSGGEAGEELPGDEDYKRGEEGEVGGDRSLTVAARIGPGYGEK